MDSTPTHSLPITTPHGGAGTTTLGIGIPIGDGMDGTADGTSTSDGDGIMVGIMVGTTLGTDPDTTIMDPYGVEADTSVDIGTTDMYIMIARVWLRAEKAEEETTTKLRPCALTEARPEELREPLPDEPEPDA